MTTADWIMAIGAAVGAVIGHVHARDRMRGTDLLGCGSRGDGRLVGFITLLGLFGGGLAIDEATSAVGFLFHACLTGGALAAGFTLWTGGRWLFGDRLAQIGSKPAR